MNIYVTKNGEMVGPYSEQEAADGIDSTDFSPSDLAWCEGQSTWMPLSQILGKQMPDFPPLPGDAHSAVGLLAIARRVNSISLILEVIGALLVVPVPEDLLPCVYCALLGLHIVNVVKSYQVAGFLGKKPWPWAVVAAIPYLGEAAMLLIVGLAATTLRRNNIPVGFFGVKRRDIKRLESAAGFSMPITARPLHRIVQRQVQP
jgi:hypothetical protein